MMNAGDPLMCLTGAHGYTMKAFYAVLLIVMKLPVPAYRFRIMAPQAIHIAAL
jgi:hypothetical protein